MAVGKRSAVVDFYVPHPPAPPRRRPARRKLRRDERPSLLTIAILTVGMRTATGLYPPLGLVRDGGLTALGRGIWPGLALASLIALRHQHRSMRWPVRPILAVIGIVALSTVWSADVGRTAYQVVVLASIVVCATYVVSRHDARTCVLIVGAYLGGICALNAVAAITDLSKPLARGGLMEHKNLIGALSAASVLATALASRLVTGRPRRWYMAGCVASLYVMVACESKSGIFSLVAASAAIGLVQLVQHRRGHVMASTLLWGTVALGVGYRLAGGLVGILDASGKDLTLTGRTEIWKYVLQVARGHRLHGWGYFAIWGEKPLDGGGSPAYVVLSGLRSSHSGYIEMYVGVGIIGLAVLICGLALLLRQAIGEAARDGLVGSWTLAVTVFAIVQNLSESVVPGTVQTMIMLLLVIASAVDRSPGLRVRRFV